MKIDTRIRNNDGREGTFINYVDHRGQWVWNDIDKTHGKVYWDDGDESIIPINELYAYKNITVKFSWAHFPVGTQFILKPKRHSSDTPGQIFTVSSLHRNGVKSYLLKTTTPSSLTDYEQFNIDHVGRIIKRGLGNAVIDSTEFKPLTSKGNKPKSAYSVLSLYPLVSQLSDRYVKPWESIDIDKIVSELFKMQWIKTTQHPFLVTVNKKRIKRFMQQNTRRFLMNLEKYEKKVREEDKRCYELDMEM